jgi:hypothetical protein
MSQDLVMQHASRRVTFHNLRFAVYASVSVAQSVATLLLRVLKYWVPGQ